MYLLNQYVFELYKFYISDVLIKKNFKIIFFHICYESNLYSYCILVIFSELKFIKDDVHSTSSPFSKLDTLDAASSHLEAPGGHLEAPGSPDSDLVSILPTQTERPPTPGMFSKLL